MIIYIYIYELIDTQRVLHKNELFKVTSFILNFLF
jgi:hypothetical protein